MEGVDHTLQLAEYLSSLKYEDLPSEAVLQAKKSLLNALGCGLGYALHAQADKVFSVIQNERRCPDATIIGRRERTSIENAALINGVAMTTADYDDTHLKTVIHPSGTPLAALISYSEGNSISGEDFLLAFICGVEAQCAVGNALTPAHYRDGWHITGTTGSFGAAAAIAKAQRLNPGQFAAALGHAASMAGGLRAMFGTDTKTLHMGRAAQNGLLASELAQQDFGSCSQPIEKWMALVTTNPENQLLSALSRGGPYQILENTFKPYPCGIVIHPLIDAAIQAHESLRPGHSAQTIDSIESIEVNVNPQCVRLCSVRHPMTGLQTIFSLYHGVAVGLLYGQAGPLLFSDQACKDQAAKRTRNLIDVSCDAKLADDAAILTITFADKCKKAIHCEHATGSMERPMEVEQLEAKFTNMADGVLGTTQSRAIIDHCWHLERLEDVRSFVRLLAPP